MLQLSAELRGDRRPELHPAPQPNPARRPAPEPLAARTNCALKRHCNRNRTFTRCPRCNDPVCGKCVASLCLRCFEAE